MGQAAAVAHENITTSRPSTYRCVPMPSGFRGLEKEEPVSTCATREMTFGLWATRELTKMPVHAVVAFTTITKGYVLWVVDCGQAAMWALPQTKASASTAMTHSNAGTYRRPGQ